MVRGEGKASGLGEEAPGKKKDAGREERERLRQKNAIKQGEVCIKNWWGQRDRT